MEINIKIPEINIGRKKKDEASSSAFDARTGGVVFGASSGAGASSGFGAGDSADSFGVNVRNEAAGINLLDEKAADPWWRRELPHEIATGAALMSFFAFMLSAAGTASMIPFLLAGVAVYMGLVVLEEKFEGRIKLLAAAGISVALLVLLVVLRKYIGGGLGSIMNSVYEVSEAEQAYIYNKFNISEAAQSSPETCIKFAVIWVSALAGAIGSMPPAAFRRLLGLAVAAFAFIAFAYYGIVPAALVVVLAVVVIMFVLNRGGILSALPVMLAALLFFGAVMLISPGENYGISRTDEKIRDRLALRSAYLESEYNAESPTESDNLFKKDTDTNTDSEVGGSHKGVVSLIITALILAAVAGVGYLLYKRFIRKRDANRAGIDSDDIRTAIVAMFPYAVRWLGASGMEVSGKSFASLVEPLRHNVSDQYSNYFSSMYVLWREAAYSDHEMEEEKRDAMRAFMNDTKEMVSGAMNRKEKLLTALKYAL